MEDRDAYLELSVSEDGMEARASLYPAVGNGRMLEPDYVDTVLETQGVVDGIDTEAIAEAILAVNTERRMKEDVVVARGLHPVRERAAFWRIILDTGPRPVTWDDDERADYRQVTKLPVVHPGELVAKMVPMREGVPGINVRGEEIPFTVEPVDAPQPGDNVRVDEDRAYAEIGGQFQVVGGFFRVEDRLEISGDVGYETGSIEFPGDVVLKGEVKDGFHIWAGRSVSALVTVDVSEIYCRGDFTSKLGVIGRGKALLRCGGKVQSRFVTSCHVESKESIYVEQYAYMSHLGCQDRLAMGKKGRLVGGTVTAANGIRAFSVGNKAGVPTVVRVGIDFIAERKLRLIREKHQAVTLRLQRFTQIAGDDPSDRQLDILRHLEDRRNRLAIRMGEVAGALDANEDAEIIVDGTVFPGVVIQVCRATHRVDRQLAGARFRLEKSTGHVLELPLKDDQSPNQPQTPTG